MGTAVSSPATISTDTVPPAEIPEIHLLCMVPEFITAFEAAKEKYNLPSSVKVTIHHNNLKYLPTDVKFDAIVSPANSYARLDGGFDDALSRAFAPRNDYHALTRVAQAKVYREWRGFAPPSSCTMVDLDHPDLVKPGWGCRYMALLPTMKTPQNVGWDKEVVYECVWALLATIDRHNRAIAEDQHTNERRIKSILMTPLATGCGLWGAEKWAAQTVIAIKHFVEASAEDGENKWGKMDWREISAPCEEVEDTYDLEG
ncbi:macro domain-like protein [Aaosphaeria arxii CBS 175.79]|uniref:Macro domain-like protein n=1 Tax=Aaosphaeria arxii CBS 175.79 TaxID=1450172 RepID=A0A6A5XYK6_9PLEO|nr:macro domain-like protein [Aaosphaeria arxii CBS 175.79]KAF2018252.1 macro domain-like protein [Aaosphaeria arxii CBS 175.79]